SNRMRERLALAVMGHIASQFVSGRPAWTLQQLTEQLDIPMHAVHVVLDALEDCGFLVKSHDDPPAYLPARDLADVPVPGLIPAVRKGGEDGFLDREWLVIPAAADELVNRVERAIHASLENVSVKALVAEGGQASVRNIATVPGRPRLPIGEP